MTATAADDVGVSGVQFKLDGAEPRGRGHERALLRALGHHRRGQRRPQLTRRRPRRRRQHAGPPPPSTSRSRTPGRRPARPSPPTASTRRRARPSPTPRGATTPARSRARCARRRPRSTAARSPSTASTTWSRSRRQLARPHQRDDARGLGPADGERQLPHRDHQGDDRQPRLRAVLELDGVREQQRARPSAWITSNGIGGTAALPANTWTHLAATYDGATWRFYLNGVQVAQQAFTGAIPVSTGALRIGGNNIWGEWFAGQIDEVRVYARALTAARGRARPRHADRRAAAGRHHRPTVSVTRARGRRDGGRDGQRDRERLRQRRRERRAVQARRRQPRRRGHQRALLRGVGHAHREQRRATR